MKFLNKKLIKSSLCFGLIFASTIPLTSCKERLWIAIDKIDYPIISAPGLTSFQMGSFYNYTDEYLFIERDEKKLEKAFEEDYYKIIGYDTLKGLRLCEKYGNYVLLRNYVVGSHCIVKLNDKEGRMSKEDKILANNEDGSLGFILKLLFSDFENIEYTTLNNTDFYNKIKNGDYSSTYDYVILPQPYVDRLTDPAFKEEGKTFVNQNQIKDYYRKYINDLVDQNNQYLEDGIFVSKTFLKDNYKKMYQFKDCTESVMGRTIENASAVTNYLNVKGDIYEQFNKFDLSTHEINNLQAWDKIFHKSYNYMRYDNNFTNADLKMYCEKMNIKFNNIDDLLIPDDYFVKKP